MKKYLLLIPTLLLSMSLSAQSEKLSAQPENRFSLELDLARLASPHGLFDANIYDYAFSFLNGARLIYQASSRWGAFVGVRRLPFELEENSGFTREVGEMLGMELRAGALFSPHKSGRFSVSYGLEVFGERARVEGTYVSDAPPSYEILYRKSYIGLAPSLLFRFALTSRISLLADTRFQLGQAFFQPLESSPAGQEVFVATNFSMNNWNPLNSFALRIAL